MKQTHRFFLMTAAAAALVLAATASSSRPISKKGPVEDVRHAIEAGNTTWEKAFRSLDAAAMASIFDEEGVNVSADDGTCMKGRVAIEAAMRAYLERSGPATSTKVEIGDVALDGDLAYEWGRSEVHFAPKPGGPTERTGRYVAVWKRQSDGGWKLFRNLGLHERPPT